MTAADPLPDWTLVRTFLAVVEEGSYSGAARVLGSSQPTVGRHVDALEAALGARLFRRHAQGMVPTEAGADLIEPARKMRRAAQAVNLAVAGRSAALAGTVRITASVATAHYTLPPIIARIGEALPDVAIELVPNDRAENLLFREADIAVRMFRPTQLDIVTRHIGAIPLGIYGAARYLDRHGRPSRMDEVRTHRFVGYDRDDQIIRGFRERGIHVGRDFFRTRCDMNSAYWELVRAGCGLGFGQVPIGDADPNVERVMAEVPLPSLPVWLSAHEAIRHTPRVRKVWDMLAEGLSAVVS